VSRDQIAVQANLGAGTVTAYLTQQKNNTKFHVVDGAGNTAICEFVDGGTLAVGQMSCQATVHGGGNFNVSRITNRFVWDFTSTGTTGTGSDTNRPGTKYYWGFVDQAPDSLLDAPSYGFAVLPSASRPADANEAP